ncbi:hypothetical protein DDZ14_07770 [Maritimibacter sp. 55A14]|uniref:hypothetical protein n=1 Tax=Maritimibacter sp. 55A14 TaxID=2174844 RepID=UPI000D603EBD|nr:hypothetical protein [Maritimibacter sp. 55A14]PWE32979.1 hypothetical protein DDZ14_07770 [Maritimibacter sp. 55A14]
MTWVLTIVITVLLVELLLRLPLLAEARAVAATARRAAHVVGARGISDHWKEKAVPAYAGRMLRASLMLLVWLGLIGLAGTVLTLLADRLAPGTSGTLLSGGGLALSLIAATAHVLLRQRLVRG